MGLVDLHCHILPGVDDGAASDEDAVGMARQAEADGIAVVCATPHIRHDHDVRIHELRARAARLEVVLGEHGVRVAIAPAGEVAETALDGLDETELRLVSIGGHGRWVLVEPAPGPLSTSLMAALDHLHERGARGILAHPERHLGADFFARLEELVAHGALVQLTAAHVLDAASGPVLCELAERGLAHLVGSDAHSSQRGRPVAVRAAIERLEAHAGPALGAFLREAPAAMVRGDDVEPPQAAASAGA